MRSSIARLLHLVRAVVLRQEFLGALEEPADARTTRTVTISGWAFSRRSTVVRVEARLGTHALHPPAYGFARPDVARIFDRAPGAARSGFQARVAIDPGLAGPFTLVVTIADEAGHTCTFSRNLHITPPRRAPAGHDPAFDSRPLPSTSIVIPIHGRMADTEACLDQLHATLPPDAAVEIIVVDDGSRDETAARLAQVARREPRLRVLANERNLGFVESCNRGAQAARHDVLVFLNNDTLPQAGWLPPLLTLLRSPAVGAVGAKLVYPDGSLQEAGGVVFDDASAWNFGKGSADPDDPLFNTVREVDYCSGAVLATRRTTFADTGGFDTRFSPAYYEDTDYCFALRARGLAVLYQPASVVVHVEGATAGTDERTGAKQSQIANRATFRGKWRDALRAQPAPATPDRAALYRFAVRARGARRALIWSPTLPEWDRESGSRRLFDLMTFFRERAWAVSLVAESTAGGERYVAALQQMGVAVYDTPEPDLVSLGRFDVALFQFWWMAEQHAPLIRRDSPRTRVVVDSVDLHFLRHARDPNRAANADDADKSRELESYAAADAVLTVSDREAAVLAGACSRAHPYVVPDAESLALAHAPFEERRGLLFLGNFRHHPNVDALAFLMRAIVPLLPMDLLERHPLTIVGTDLTDAIVERCGARRPGVLLNGWVPSVEPYLERSRLMVVPLTYGAGTKRKLVQAAMTGLPAVSTTVGIEGLPLRDGESVLVADDASAFAAAIVRLADDRAAWERLRMNGRNAMAAAHDRPIVRRRFDDVIDRLLA